MALWNFAHLELHKLAQMRLSVFFFSLSCREQYTYSCGRESVILGVHPFTLKANISDRVAQLAMPKPVPEGHEKQRSVCFALFRLCACCRYCLLFTAYWNHHSDKTLRLPLFLSLIKVIK